jgi:glycosyltransferase involved in cell wall biosynthesis
VTAALDQSDLLLVPSRWPEPFGMVGVEAALRGVPAVASAVGGIPEWLTDGATGRLVPGGPKSAERFAEAVVACLRDEPMLARMRDLGRAAAARFGMAPHLAALEPVLAAAAGMPALATPIDATDGVLA